MVVVEAEYTKDDGKYKEAEYLERLASDGIDQEYGCPIAG